MFTAAELTSMRATAAEALPGTAIIQSQGWVSDGGGAGTTTWTPAGTSDCRIAPVGGQGGREEEQGDRITAHAEFIVTLPSDITVTTDDRIVIGSATYNIEAIRDRSWNLSTRVEVVEET